MCQTLERERCERLQIPYVDPAEIINEDQFYLQKQRGGDEDKLEHALSNQLSFHVIGPLIDSYEQTIASL